MKPGKTNEQTMQSFQINSFVFEAHRIGRIVEQHHFMHLYKILKLNLNKIKYIF
jgi:hypothetical protein